MPLNQRTVDVCRQQGELRKMIGRFRDLLEVYNVEHCHVDLAAWPGTSRGFTVDSVTLDDTLTLTRAEMQDAGLLTFPDLDHATVEAVATTDAGISTITIKASDPVTIGPWLNADTDRITAWLLEDLPTDDDHPAQPRYARFGIHDEWGDENGDAGIDWNEAAEITDVLVEMVRAGVIVSPIGAEVALEPLADVPACEGEVRVMVDFGDSSTAWHKIVGSATPLRFFLAAETDDEPNPALTRLITAVVAAINNGNAMLDKFFATFTPRF